MARLFQGQNIVLNNVMKHAHRPQYPPKTTRVYCYCEARGGDVSSLLFFGLQTILKQWFEGVVVTADMISEAKELLANHNLIDYLHEDEWQYIVEKHGGRLPLSIRAVPEGTIVPCGNVLFTVENTDPQCWWLPDLFQDELALTWYPTMVATTSKARKDILAHYLEQTADSLDDLPYKLNNGGFKSASCVEASSLGSLATMVNFYTTYCTRAWYRARAHYGCDNPGDAHIGNDHAKTIIWGEANEKEMYENMFEQYVGQPFGIVLDSYDPIKACEIICKDLHCNVVQHAESGGCLTLRLDSGDPVPTMITLLTTVEKHFGSFCNSKGYKQLPDYIRMNYSNNVTVDNMTAMLEGLAQASWSTDNICFNSGTDVIQRVDRDMLGFVYKISHAVVDGKEMNVSKEPSKMHRLKDQRKGD